MIIQEGIKGRGREGMQVDPGLWHNQFPFITYPLCSYYSTIRTKVYAILELWVQVCGASAGVLQGGASGEALLTHLLSDISPPSDALKVSENLSPVPFVQMCPFTTLSPTSVLPFCLPLYNLVSVFLYHQLRSPRGSPDGGLQTGKPSAPKKIKLDVGEAMAPPSHRKGENNANSDVCAAALRGW